MRRFVKGYKKGENNAGHNCSLNDPTTNSAYLPPDLPYKRVITVLPPDKKVITNVPPDVRVIANSEGVFFCLQLNRRFVNSLNDVPFGDLIILYQKLNG
jgi:hypothetical protein